MGLDAKTYWLTDRQSQYDFDFDFDFDLRCTANSVLIFSVMLQANWQRMTSRT
jgi:hypothetical protein